MKNNIFRITLTTLLLVICGIAPLVAQNSNVKKMQQKAAGLRKEIEQQKKILLSTENDVNSQLRNLKIIEDRIVKQKRLVELMKEEVAAMDAEIERIQSEIAVQEERVRKSREEYAEALRRARKYGKAKNKLHYVMAADDFNTMMRRYRYANTYMDAHERLAKSLQEQINVLEGKNAELQRARTDREASVKEQEGVSRELGSEEVKQKQIVSNLQNQKSKLQAEIKRKQKELDKQNKRINDEIERILREEEAARRKAEEEARKKSQAKSAGKTTKSAGSSKGSYVADAGVAAMSGDFEKNRKKMPVPITGSYIVVERFGTQNVVGNNGNVKIRNNGVVFEGSAGAKARAIFDGTVQRVINEGNYHFILIRHGDYITVYCDIENPKVKDGDKVKAGDILGNVGIDPKHNVPRMQFQMRKRRTMLDPAQWLKM